MRAYAVNLGFLFTEEAFLDRFAAARRAGFTAVEFPWPDVAIADVAAAVHAAGVHVVQLNCHAGDLGAGERGYPNDPSLRRRWRAVLDEALAWSGRLGCGLVNVLAGNRIEGMHGEAQWACLEENLAWALPRARDRGVVLLLEVLNDRDTPGYLLTRLSRAVAVLDRLQAPNLRLQFDTYHIALMEGAVDAAFERAAPHVAHVQIADAPGRHEPGTGAVDFPGFFRALDRGGYHGAVSLEYVPRSCTEDGLRWLPPELRGATPPKAPW